MTGDCRYFFRNNRIFIKNHIKNNSDLTCAINFAVGTAGEIYSVGSLEQILQKTKRLDILNIYLSITLIIQVI